MKKKIDPRMHSAEHILNRTVERMFGCGRCFSAHIEPKRSRCYFHFDRALTQAEVDELQSRVNSVIEANLPVTDTQVTKEKAELLYDTGMLPDHLDTDRIRIVHIGDYDACPCIGDHVNATREIGSFSITTTSFEDGVLKIRFKLA